MARYAAFLRAINIGGRRVKGPELCKPCTGMGFEGAASFRASGNVVFDAPRKPAEARIVQQLEKELGYEVVVFVRSATELHSLSAGQPFEPETRYHFMFLKALPSPAKQRDVL